MSASDSFTGHFRRNLLPARAGLLHAAARANDRRHLRFRPARAEEAWSYNVLQRLTYLLVIFVLFPLVIWTGLAMSPAIASAIPAAVTILGGQQSARTLHFFVSVFLVLFLVVHVVMVGLSGFRNRVRRDDYRPPRRTHGANMSKISRRKLVTIGLAATAGASGLAVAANLARRYGLIPPDGGGLYGPGETLTYAAQRLLTRHSSAREFDRSQISQASVRQRSRSLGRRLQAPAGRSGLRTGASPWMEWSPARHLSRSPNSRRFPVRSQITHLACEEGWSYIAEWSGVPLSHILELVGTLSRRPATWSTVRSSPTGGKASTWPMPCTRRRSSRTV